MYSLTAFTFRRFPFFLLRAEMPKSCAVFGCSSYVGKKGCEPVSFYRLPLRNPKLLDAWVHRLRTPSIPRNGSTRVCSLHWQDGKRKAFDDLPANRNPTLVGTSRRSLERRHSTTAVDTAEPAVTDVNPEGDRAIAIGVSAADVPVDGCSESDVDGEVSDRDSEEVSRPAPLACPDDPDASCLTSECHWKRRAQALENQVHELQATLLASQNRVASAEAELEVVKRSAFEEFVAMPIVVASTSASASPADPEHPTTSEHFSFSSVESNDSLVRFYTGMPSAELFNALFGFLEDCVPNLMYWHGGKARPATDLRHGHSLSPKDELFLTLVKLRLDAPYVDLAMRFGISTGSVSKVFNTWLSLMYRKFKELSIWPSRSLVDEAMPQQFKDLYPSTRVIIDCTEFPIEKPSDPDTQRSTWSSYKNRNTFKLLLGISPAGAVTFMSSLFGGSVSDNELTLSCGILDKLQPGDSIMADKGFVLESHCKARQVVLNIPPFLGKDTQLSQVDMIQTRRIASLRVHVERAMERLKNFHILDFISSPYFGVADELVFVCAMLGNFQPNLIE